MNKSNQIEKNRINRWSTTEILSFFFPLNSHASKGKCKYCSVVYISWASVLMSSRFNDFYLDIVLDVLSMNAYHIPDIEELQNPIPILIYNYFMKEIAIT